MMPVRILLLLALSALLLQPDTGLRFRRKGDKKRHSRRVRHQREAVANAGEEEAGKTAKGGEVAAKSTIARSASLAQIAEDVAEKELAANLTQAVANAGEEAAGETAEGGEAAAKSTIAGSASLAQIAEDVVEKEPAASVTQVDPMERRVDPMLDNRFVTFQEMSSGYAAQHQELSEEQLLDHWNNLPPTEAPTNEVATQTANLVQEVFGLQYTTSVTVMKLDEIMQNPKYKKTIDLIGVGLNSGLGIPYAKSFVSLLVHVMNMVAHPEVWVGPGDDVAVDTVLGLRRILWVILDFGSKEALFDRTECFPDTIYKDTSPALSLRCMCAVAVAFVSTHLQDYLDELLAIFVQIMKDIFLAMHEMEIARNNQGSIARPAMALLVAVTRLVVYVSVAVLRGKDSAVISNSLIKAAVEMAPGKFQEYMSKLAQALFLDPDMEVMGLVSQKHSLSLGRACFQKLVNSASTYNAKTKEKIKNAKEKPVDWLVDLGDVPSLELGSVEQIVPLVSWWKNWLEDAKKAAEAGNGSVFVRLNPSLNGPSFIHNLGGSWKSWDPSDHFKSVLNSFLWLTWSNPQEYQFVLIKERWNRLKDIHSDKLSKATSTLEKKTLTCWFARKVCENQKDDLAVPHDLSEFMIVGASTENVIDKNTKFAFTVPVNEPCTIPK